MIDKYESRRIRPVRRVLLDVWTQSELNEPNAQTSTLLSGSLFTCSHSDDEQIAEYLWRQGTSIWLSLQKEAMYSTVAHSTDALPEGQAGRTLDTARVFAGPAKGIVRRAARALSRSLESSVS